MKKNLILGMAALLGMSLAFTACSSDDDPAGSAAVNDNAIGFSVLTNNAAGTRATAITPSNASTEMKNFVVWGAYTSNISKYYLGTSDKGIQFNNTDGKWDYASSADQKYWPSEALTFYAVSPASAEGLNFTSADITYTIPTDQSKQVDLMYAYTPNQTKPTGGKADLKFNHLLSQVLFKAKTASNTLEVEIKSITIHNVINNIFYNRINTSNPVEGGGALERSNYAVGLASAVTVPTDGSVVDATDANGVLMLKPQEIQAWTTGNVSDAPDYCYIEIEAKYKSADSYLLGSADAYGKTYIGLGGKWEAGKKYIYTLIFGKKGDNNNGGGKTPDGEETLIPIDFNVTVADWTDSTSDINL